MNLSVYLFGQSASGYNQFPDDYTRSIFKKFKDNCQARTQVAIHRDDNVMYYGYIRMLEEDCYIGFCVVVNGYYTTNCEKLFAYFENIVEMMAEKGYLIHFDDHGKIVASSSRMYEDKEAIAEIQQSLTKVFDNLEYKRLPSVNYSIDVNTIKKFSKEDFGSEIVAPSYTYGYTFLYKSKKYDTNRLLGYKGVIARLSKQKEELSKQKEELEKELSKEKSKKSHAGCVGALLALLVVTLVIVVVLCIGYYTGYIHYWIMGTGIFWL